MEKIIKEGKELEPIISEILNEFNLKEEELYYKYYTKKSGLFGKNSTIVVEAITKDSLIKYIKSFLEELTTNLGVEANFESKFRDGTIEIKIHSNNNAILIGKNGNTIKSMEIILKQHIQTTYGIKPYIKLDVENYKEKNEHRLISLAKKLAKEVNNTKMEVHLEPMSPYDRRLIHNALTDFKGIKTESEGEGQDRHIVIKPV
jgi:spoIIIJ-associated protein